MRKSMLALKNKMTFASKVAKMVLMHIERLLVAHCLSFLLLCIKQHNCSHYLLERSKSKIALLTL